jgi:HSP20 family protein
MANVSTEKNSSSRPTIARRWDGRPDPLRVVRELMGWDPMHEMVPFERVGEAEFLPAFEVKENKDGFVFKADLPGVNEADINITLNGNRLTVSGKREAEKQAQNETYYTYERSYGAFSRSFTLPDGIDSNAIKAELTNGVLTLSIQKIPEAQPKKITVQTVAKS